MARFRTPIRSIAAGLAGCLLSLVAWTQDGNVVVGASDPVARIEVNGVLIGPRSRSALINGQVLRVGDYVGDIEIIAIDNGSIRLRSGSKETGVMVGTSTSINSLGWSTAEPEHVIPKPILLADIPVPTAVPVPTRAIPEPQPEPVLVEAMPLRHAVAPGETLSEIAEAYLASGVRRHQLMMALFDANPHAFGGNINRMWAGVVLDIPDVDALASVPPGTAMVEVMEQTDHWKSERQRLPKMAQAKRAETYGPVTSGETLSHIAHRLTQSGADAWALMSALYRDNPHAFGKSMDHLRVGVVLNIPDEIHIGPSPGEDIPVVAQVSAVHEGL